MVKQAVKEALILVGVSVGVALLVYWVRPDKIDSVSSGRDHEMASANAVTDPIRDISLNEAVRHFNERSAIFVDARHQADFDAGHIQGALNLYLADQEMWLSDFVASTDPAEVIITYCDGEACHLAPELAEFLFFNGFDEVCYLKNGWSVWKDGGHPVNEP